MTEERGRGGRREMMVEVVEGGRGKGEGDGDGGDGEREGHGGIGTGTETGIGIDFHRFLILVPGTYPIFNTSYPDLTLTGRFRSVSNISGTRAHP
ncbi:hypothetical protein CRG98_022301 [Punica granatum]|uniref:Uncharacterized protein n=1 Tax=Punica granatum TaxID=22663 RepID=A0A2I0JLY8_PUNGR|nr:hypothetical protein CRG98_022301 [Punica granatum]